MAETANATLTTYITDMHALVNHGLQAINRQADSLKADHPQALAAVHEFQRTLRSHLTLLDARAKALGGRVTRPLKDVVTTVTGLLAGLVGAFRPEQAAKAIRDDYTGLSHIAIGYLMLYTTASGLGDRETAALAEHGYRDVARLIMHIDRVMPGLVVQELRRDNLHVADVEADVHAMISRSWSREAADVGLGAGPTSETMQDVRPRP